MTASPNVTWQDGNISRTRRWEALGACGATVWLTGLPASGKSTLGAALEQHLVESGRFAYLLDGDNLRHGLCGDLGFSAADRTQNMLRAGEVARLFADGGAVAIVALVSPLAAVRDEVRRRHTAAQLRFIEVFVDTPLDECESRDPKELYARARAGEIQGFTGVDEPYELPAHPELIVRPDLGVAGAVDAVLRLLDSAGAPAGAPGKEPPRRRSHRGPIHQRNGVKR